MSKYEKLKERMMSIPSDFTYTELRTFLTHIGFVEINKGRTSGSRVLFYRQADSRGFLLHKPHPGDIMKKGALKQVVIQLKEWGEI